MARNQKRRETNVNGSRLRERLAEAEQTLASIRNGDVDAIEVDGPHGHLIFTLQTADQPYRILVEQMSEGAASMTTEGTILFCNQRLAAMVGRPAEQLLGASAAVFVAPGERKDLLTLLARASQGEVREELQFQHASGAVVPILASLKSTSINQSQTLCLVATDLTELKRAENEKRGSQRALHESEQRLHIALDAANSGAWEWDLRTNQKVWSDGLWKLYGLRPHSCEPSYEAWRSIVLPDDRDEAERIVSEAARDRQEINFEFRVQHPDGTVHWLLSRGHPMSDEAGRPIRFIGIVLDVTDRKLAEEALRESEQRLRLFIEHAPAGLAMFDREMRYLQASRRWRQDYGLDDRDLTGLSHYDLFPEIPERWKEAHRRGLAGEIVRDDNDRFERADGSLQWIRWEIRPWRETSGKIGGIVLFSEDMTATKEAEEALRQSEGRLRALVNASSDVVYRMNPDWSEMRRLDGRGFIADTTTPNKDWLQAYIYPEDHALVTQTIENAVRRKSVFELEHRVRQADGSIGWTLSRAVPRLDANGEIIEWVGMASNVTPRKIAEETLRENHARLKKVFEVETVGVLFWDLTTGRLVDANDTFLNLMGYSRSDVEAGELTWQKLTPPEYLEVSRSELRKFAASGRVGPYEKEYFRKDGTRQWFVFAGSSLGGNSCVEFCVDISERKKAEAALRESEERVRTLMESTAEAILGDDLEGNCTFCNPAALRLLGYQDQADLLGKNLHGAIHHSRPDGTSLSVDDCLLGQSVRGGHPFYSDDLVFWRKDGTRFPAECWSHPVLNEGKTVGSVLTFFDISERKRAQEEVVKGRARLEAALSSMTDAVFISDTQGRFLDFNDGFATFHKFKSKAECAKTLAEYPEFLDVFMENGQPAPLEMWAVPRALRGETVTDAEYTLRRKDTGETWVGSYSFAPIRDRNGVIVGSVVVGRDITQQKATEREIRRLNEDLERRVEQRTAQLQSANKELEAFTYSVSHDLRAPLRHISGFSKMLLEEFSPGLPPQAQHYVERISDGTRRMGLLVDDLLNLGRVGRQELRLQVTGLRSLVDEIISELQPDCADRQVEWKIGDLPFVDCDPGLVKQVLQNLLSNALKFTRPRVPAVIEIRQQEEDGQPVIYVKDNGVGFSMKYADKLFGVFQRLHRQEDFEGTGVGLATVQRIIQKHGGRIWAEAELERGATFYFTLAAADSGSEAAKSLSVGGGI